MEIRQFKYFVQIVEQGSLSRAALSLYIAQPALSQQIAKLEAELGVKLLSRSVRGVCPTDAGNAFYKQARSFLKQVSSMHDLVTSLGNHPSGSVSVGLATSTAIVLGSPFISAMRDKLPHVQMELTESPSVYLTELLINGRIDVAVLFGDGPIKGLSMQEILLESLFLVGQPGSLGGSDPVTLQEVGKYPLILPCRPNSLRNHVETAFNQRGIEYEIKTEINGTHILREAVREGLGFSVMPWSAFHMEIDRGALVSRRIVEPELFRSVSICVSDVLPKTYATECVSELLSDTIAGLVTGKSWSGVSLLI